MKNLMLYQFDKPHSSHRIFGESVNCDYMHFEKLPSSNIKGNLNNIRYRIRQGLLSSKYDLVIGEGSATVQNLIVAGSFPKTKTILLVADETFLHSNKNIWKIISPIANKTIDKAICVSELAREWMDRILNVKSSVVHPPISEEKYNTLKSCKKSYNIRGEPEIVTLASLPSEQALKKKNTETLANATKNIANLTILGSGHDKYAYANYDHVKTLGYVSIEKIKEVFKRSDAYVLPSRNDTFPVSTLESMLSGLPTIVSNMCGTKVCVEPIDEKLVCETSEESIRSSINYVLSQGSDYRKSIGSQMENKVKEFTLQNQARKFRNEVQRL